jgi:hypothetical protein
VHHGTLVLNSEVGAPAEQRELEAIGWPVDRRGALSGRGVHRTKHGLIRVILLQPGVELKWKSPERQSGWYKKINSVSVNTVV